MGLISSMCKRRHEQDKDKHSIIDNDYIPTGILKKEPSTNFGSNATICSVISREPNKNLSINYHQELYSRPTRIIRSDPDLPLFSTPFFIPFQNKPPLSSPYIAHAYSSSPSIIPENKIRHGEIIRTRFDKETSHFPEVTLKSATVQTIEKEKRDSACQTTDSFNRSLTDNSKSISSKSSPKDGSRLVKRTTSAPIDMFLVDISSEHVMIDQPIALNIRHVLLDTVENHQNQGQNPIRIEPATATTYAYENLINYIPYVCERYPTVTIPSNQSTRNTLHMRVPSQFSQATYTHI